MMCTIDGRIIVENWGDEADKFMGLYEECHRTYKSQAWMAGRVTLEKDFTEGKKPTLKKASKVAARVPFVGDPNANSFAIAVDPKGKLGWMTNEIDGDHIVEILTETVSDAYVNYLIDKNISFIFAGNGKINFKSAFEQLAERFSIRTIMLEGGGHINGSVLNDGLVDEISLLVIPVVDGTPKAPTTFEISEYLQRKSATALRLKQVKKLKNGVLWVIYRVKGKS